MPKVAQVPIIVLSLLIALSTLSLVGCTQRREPHNRAETKSPAPDPLAGLSKLHRSIIGHWIEYRTHTHAYISKSAIVLTREDTPGRQETYSYRVYSEDQFLSTLLLKVKQSGDITEETWEAQAIDYGQGVKLFIGRTQFSYVDSHTQPYLRQDDEIIVSTDSASNNMALERELMDIESQSKYNQREVERQLGERYGWTMTIQHDYWVAIDSTAARFFWVRRANPPGIERWIFIHQMDAPDAAILTDAFVLERRDSLTKQYMKTFDDDAHVQIAPYNVQIDKVDFLGRFAYATRGNWRFSDKSGGGPFVNYTLYDPETRRIYMLDGSVFAPRVEKKKLILEVEALLHTFRTVAQREGNGAK